jgi:hypothetical protein
MYAYPPSEEAWVTSKVVPTVVGGGGVTVLKVAVTLRFLFKVSVHVGAVPLQFPPQYENVLPVVGVAVRYTLLLYGTERTQGDTEHVCPPSVVTMPCP